MKKKWTHDDFEQFMADWIIPMLIVVVVVMIAVVLSR